MRKWKLYAPVLLIFLCLTAVTVRELGRPQSSEGGTPAELRFRDGEHGLTLTPVYDPAEDTYFLYLPGFTDPDRVTVRQKLFFAREGEALGTKLRDLPQGQTVELTMPGGTYDFQLWQCGPLPAIFLETKPDALDHLHADKKNKAGAQVTALDGSGEAVFLEAATLSGRGNGTWREQEKRPYNLHFSRPVTFGTLEELSDLCLFAEYSDESKLRNSLAYYAGQELGIPYASPYVYTDLWLNGEYLGLYGVTTKKEYEKHTGDLKAVFELTSKEGPQVFRSGFFGQPLAVMYGDMGHVETIVNQFESALYFEDWESCEELADLDSLARKYALDEFLGNIDMTYASQYFYLDREDRIHCMLPWDYDFSLFSAITHFNNKQEFAVLGYRDPFHYSWTPALLGWPEFRERAARVLEEEFTDEFLEKLDRHLAEDIGRISVSRDCDLRRWKNAQPYSEDPLQSGFTELSEFYDLFSGYFPRRRAFLIQYLRNAEDYCCVSFTGIWYGNVCVPRGTRLADAIDGANFLNWEMEGYEFTGWRTEDGRAPEDVELVEEDLPFIATFIDLNLPTEP